MKKVVSLVLALVLAFGICTVAFAATKFEYKGTATDVIMSSTYPDEIKPDSTINIAINWSLFEYENKPITIGSGSSTVVGEVTSSMVRSQKVTVRRSISKGSNLIDDITLEQFGSSPSRSVRIEVALVEDFVSIEDKDISLKVILYLDGDKLEEHEIDTTMIIDPIEVYAEDDYIYLGDGQVADPDKYVSNIRIDLGEGVIVTGNLFANRKYYGVAKSEVTAADDAVMAQYPTIDNVITIQQINLPTSGNCVTLEELDDQYYVYNADGNYIGTSNEKLPYSNKYYLSTERITMGGSTESSDAEPSEVEPSTPVDPAQPTPGGDDLTDASNDNDNPGTGVNGFVSVAMVAGVVALAAAGAVSMKK